MDLKRSHRLVDLTNTSVPPQTSICPPFDVSNVKQEVEQEPDDAMTNVSNTLPSTNQAGGSTMPHSPVNEGQSEGSNSANGIPSNFKVKQEPGLTKTDMSGNYGNDCSRRAVTPDVEIWAYARLRGGDERIKKRRSSFMDKGEPRRKSVKMEIVAPEDEVVVHEYASCNKCGSGAFLFYKCLLCPKVFLCRSCNAERTAGDRHNADHPVQQIMLETGLDGKLRVKLLKVCCPICCISMDNSSDFVKHILTGHNQRDLPPRQCPLCLESCKFTRLGAPVVAGPNILSHVRESHKKLLKKESLRHEFSLEKADEGTTVIWNDFAAKVEAEKKRLLQPDVKKSVADDRRNGPLTNLVQLTPDEIGEVKAVYRPSYNPPEIRYFLSKDLSHGKELQPIPVFSDECNETDNVAPFTYIKENVIADSLLNRPVDHPKSKIAGVSGGMICCSCTDVHQCGTESCECYAFTQRYPAFESVLDREFLDPLKSDRFEDATVLGCGDLCKCAGQCANRLRTDYTRDLFLEVFKRKENSHGFGLRTMVAIPKGKVVAEFVGDVVLQKEVEKRGKKSEEYSFRLYYPNELKKSNAAKTVSKIVGVKNMPKLEVQVDPSRSGNFARFFSHGCRPNLFTRRYTENRLLPEYYRLLQVAMSTIPAGAELLISYGSDYLRLRNMKCTCFTPFCDSFPVSRSTREKVDSCKKVSHIKVRNYFENGFDVNVNKRVVGESQIFKMALEKGKKMEPVMINDEPTKEWVETLEQMEKRMANLDIARNRKKIFR